ncbi:MAG: DUF6265 family protein [Candidatus Acidiferrales bacterium]
MKTPNVWRRMILKSAMLGTLLLGLVASPMGTGGTARGRQLGPGAATKSTIADFAWIAGRWRGTFNGYTADAVYMEPEANCIGGVLEVYQPGKTLVVELSNLVQSEDGITLYIRHFTPDLQPQETGNATLLKLTSVQGDTAEFDNPVNRQPARALITRTGPDSFTAHSDVYDDQGKLTVVEIAYSRAM